MHAEHCTIRDTIRHRGPVLRKADTSLAPEAAQGQRLRVCTVSDDATAVLNLADCLVGMPAHERTDLALKEAATVFDDARATGDRFDLVLVALEVEAGTLPKQAQQILDSAAPASGRIFLLVDDGIARKITLPANATRADPNMGHALPRLLADALDELRAGDTTAAEPAVEEVVPEDGRDGPTTEATLLKRVRRLFGGQRVAAERGHPTRILTDALGRRSATIVLQGLAGGVGTTTLAANLAAELAQARSSDVVCLLDLNLQFGNAADYLGVQENARIDDAYRNFGTLDMDSFEECLMPHGKNLKLFSSSAQILPYDALTGKEAMKLVSLARQSASVLIVDMPHALTDWSGDVFGAADAVLCVVQQDIRCIRNTQKLRALLVENGISMTRFAFALNRAPEKTTPDWWETFASFETGLGARVSHFFPDGGDEVHEACDLGLVLRSAHSKNPLRRSIEDIAISTAAATYKAAGNV